jgi:alkanesulfonate monooxygenase
MSVEFIGFIGNNPGNEITPRTGPLLDVGYIETLSKAHENAGFDRALLAFHATMPDCLQVGQHIASVTERLNIFIAQRPGFTAPTLFARQFATLDHFTKGRISLNVITGGDSNELAQDGNTIDDKDERYARTKEFLDVVRLEWTSDKPFDYNGKYYQVRRGFSQIKPYQKDGIPVFIAGASDAAIEVAGHHADVFALWGETYEEVSKQLAKVKAACAKTGRAVPRFSLSFRPILADTEEKAWAKAQWTLDRAKAVQNKTGYTRKPGGPLNEGSKRLLALAAQGERLDKRLWTGMAALTDARGNSTSLVGTPDQVAESLAEYHDLGIDIFLIRGFDPLIDCIEYGRELMPRTKQVIAERSKARGVAAE